MKPHYGQQVRRNEFGKFNWRKKWYVQNMHTPRARSVAMINVDAFVSSLLVSGATSSSVSRRYDGASCFNDCINELCQKGLTL